VLLRVPLRLVNGRLGRLGWRLAPMMVPPVAKAEADDTIGRCRVVAAIVAPVIGAGPRRVNDASSERREGDEESR
jgi:hypothetical protein